VARLSSLGLEKGSDDWLNMLFLGAPGGQFSSRTSGWEYWIKIQEILPAWSLMPGTVPFYSDSAWPMIDVLVDTNVHLLRHLDAFDYACPRSQHDALFIPQENIADFFRIETLFSSVWSQFRFPWPGRHFCRSMIQKSGTYIDDLVVKFVCLPPVRDKGLIPIQFFQRTLDKSCKSHLFISITEILVHRFKLFQCHDYAQVFIPPFLSWTVSLRMPDLSHHAKTANIWL
jgi:hypothetical protein